MLLALDGVIPPAEVAVLADAARTLTYDDGRKTAGHFAKSL